MWSRYRRAPAAEVTAVGAVRRKFLLTLSTRTLRLASAQRSASEHVGRIYRMRLIEPISADFAVLVGDAIRNLRSSLNQVAYQLAMQHSGPLTEDAERMTELPIRISGTQFDDWATSKNKQTKLRRSEVFGKRGSGRFARDSRSRSPSG